MDKLGDLGHIFGISGQNYTWQICPVSVRYPDSVRILCPVSVCPDSVCLDSVRCQDSVRIFRKKSFPVSVCPDSVCLDSVRCPDFVRISQKNSVRCLSVRPDKDKTELSGLSLSLSADVWRGVFLRKSNQIKCQRFKTCNYYYSYNQIKCQRFKRRTMTIYERRCTVHRVRLDSSRWRD